MASFYNQKEFQRDVSIQSEVNSRRDTFTNVKLEIFYYYWMFTSSRLLNPSPKFTRFSQESDEVSAGNRLSAKDHVRL